VKFSEWINLVNEEQVLISILEQEILEWSKNDPIPEVTRSKDGVYLTIIGPPAAGKSTFVNKYVMAVNDWKVIDPDKVNYILSSNKHEDRNYNTHSKIASKSYSQNIKHLFNNPKKPNVVFDNTGNNFTKNLEFIKLAKENGYQTVVVAVLNITSRILINNVKRSQIPIKKDIKGTLTTSRKLIDKDYLDEILKSLGTLVENYKKLHQEDSVLDNFYVVLCLQNPKPKYKFMKFEKDKPYIMYSGNWVPSNEFDNLEDIINWVNS
jgi:predicted kinase